MVRLAAQIWITVCEFVTDIHNPMFSRKARKYTTTVTIYYLLFTGIVYSLNKGVKYKN